MTCRALWWLLRRQPLPSPRSTTELADLLESDPPLVTTYPGEDLAAAFDLLRFRRSLREAEHRRRMRGGYEIQGLP